MMILLRSESFEMSQNSKGFNVLVTIRRNALICSPFSTQCGRHPRSDEHVRKLGSAAFQLKANSSRHLNEVMGGFAWQDGYAAISVSPSQVDVVRRYIEQQERHHGDRTFEDEYTALLDKSGVQHSAEYMLG